MADSYDFSIVKGNSFAITLNVQNSDLTYINLSGYSAKGYVKNSYGDTGILFNLAPNPIEPLESGTILVSGAASLTTGIPIGDFIYNIDIYNSGDYESTVFNGNFIVAATTLY